MSQLISDLESHSDEMMTEQLYGGSSGLKKARKSHNPNMFSFGQEEPLQSNCQLRALQRILTTAEKQHNEAHQSGYVPKLGSSHSKESALSQRVICETPQHPNAFKDSLVKHINRTNTKVDTPAVQLLKQSTYEDSSRSSDPSLRKI